MSLSWVSLTCNSQKWILVGVFSCAAESSVRRSSETSCPKNLRIARKHPWWSLFINTGNFRFWNLYHNWDSTKDLFLNNWTKFIGFILSLEFIFLKKILWMKGFKFYWTYHQCKNKYALNLIQGCDYATQNLLTLLSIIVIFCFNLYKNPKK